MNTQKLQQTIETTQFSELDLLQFSKEEVEWLLDPGNYNQNNYQDGTKVRVTMWDETRDGFVAKQLDDRHFLVKLESPFRFTNPGKPWLKACRDYAHQSVMEI